MRVLEDAVDWDGVATMNEVCAILGIDAPPVRDWVNALDFDPDAAIAQLDGLRAAHASVTGTSLGFNSVSRVLDAWEGEAADRMLANSECQRGFWGHVGDFLLWLVENIVQLVDYVVDVLRIVAAWITFLVTAFSVIAAIVIIVGSAIAGMGVGAIFGALVDSAILAVAGAIAVLGILVSLVLAGLNWLVEWLQQVISDARGSICGEGLPSLPNWDPTGWEPPMWPT